MKKPITMRVMKEKWKKPRENTRKCKFFHPLNFCREFWLTGLFRLKTAIKTGPCFKDKRIVVRQKPGLLTLQTIFLFNKYFLLGTKVLDYI